MNGVINIKNWGKDEINRAGTAQIYACGDTTNGANKPASYVSMKQEKFHTSGMEAAIL